jgi:addiction module RelB/DinJ family antitoxin
MSVQISTRIDNVTKRQFDKVCEQIGISSSNALSMFIKGVTVSLLMQ